MQKMKIKNIIPPSDMRVRIQTTLTGAGGGGVASRGKFVPVFLLKNK